jgi:2'-5' RNA ligase
VVTHLETADHWWWRPGWALGARGYAFHLTFQDQPALHAHADAYRRVLAHIPALDPVPDPWLHLTMQGIGLRGEVDEAEVGAIAAAATRRLADLPAFELTFGAPVFTPEATRFEPQPSGHVSGIRDAVRAAIGEVWPGVPEPHRGFVPHVTIGYGNRIAPADPILEALKASRIGSAGVRITAAELILLGRDEGMYTWETVARMGLGDWHAPRGGARKAHRPGPSG